MDDPEKERFFSRDETTRDRVYCYNIRK